MSNSKETTSELKFDWDNKEVKKIFDAFMKFGNASATEMTGKNFDKWLKDSGVIDGKTITLTMTGIAFSKVAGPKKKVTFPEAKKVIINVAKDRANQAKTDVQEELNKIVEKLKVVEGPKVGNAAKASADGVYSRLTDHTKYTGAHKERFTEDGKGKGKAGREDITQHDGYVSSYKNKGTYDKVHSNDN
uniref:TPPP family protein (inferred by orthology to a C. elegans protein) n=1 Tax=Strongyloides venezuelensis TaxID=75913 RepID=A0A0K0F8V2_STRVS